MHVAGDIRGLSRGEEGPGSQVGCFKAIGVPLRPSGTEQEGECPLILKSKNTQPLVQMVPAQEPSVCVKTETTETQSDSQMTT